jgi:hypothetical protein
MIDTNEKSQAELMEHLQSANLPVKSIVNGKPRWVRTLTAQEQSVSDDIINNYNIGKFDYLDKRVYPDIGEQLDMLWHDMENGTTTWRDTIRAIKEANPKPTEI